MSSRVVVPSFAVVGQPNKGKSSIVATLAEDDDVAVSPVPGTTRLSRQFTLTVDGHPLYQLFDTPGFQRAGELLTWLQAQAGDAAGRAQRVADFVAQFADDPRFHDEVQLLQPIVDGCGILYVVDGTKPYGPEYEVEMEILQWTGQPRMALINMIGEGNYVQQWRDALGQYFSIVRQFDAMYADFDTRVDLLRAFAELDEASKPMLSSAVQLLLEERDRRLQQSASAIAECLVSVLTAIQRGSLAPSEDAGQRQQQLEERLKASLAAQEAKTRERIETNYRHFRLTDSPVLAQVMNQALFSNESWQVFGLSRQQLVVTGAMSGAVAGTGLDLMLGGASLMLGAGIGAALGGVSAWLGAGELAKVQVLGQSLGGRVLEVGPIQDPNFPWVILGRAWLHHSLVSERNHAQRQAMVLNIQQAAERAERQMDTVPTTQRQALQVLFNRLRKQGPNDTTELALADAIADLLRRPTVQVQPDV